MGGVDHAEFGSICQRAIERRPKRGQWFLCPCCHFYTIGEAGNWEICEICNWEDDPYQDAKPDSTSGPNGGICLIEAQANFAKFGACSESDKKFVRAPSDEELRMKHG
jgi:hypothetical protein